MTKVILVTTFPPNIGGGSVNLNSLIPHFKNVELLWVYLHYFDIEWEGCTRIGEPLMGGSLGRDIKNSLPIWLGIKTKAFEKILAKILSIKADVYWVVGHNEGVLIARELARITNIPVHLTIQDDIPNGVFARSRRYRSLSSIAQKLFAEAMRSARTVDVTSDGMQNYYQRKLGINPIVIHPYVPSLPTLPPARFENNSLIIGHIGSIYSKAEFRLFCQSLQNYAKIKGLTVQIIMIGLSRKFETIIKEFCQLIVDLPQLVESEAIEHLSQCNFLYAMYPFDKASTVFRQTSLPTKLTTYLQAQRPIFAHTPDDSSLAAVVNKYGLGLSCSALNQEELNRKIEQICHAEINYKSYENARAALYGVENVINLENCFEKT